MLVLSRKKNESIVIGDTITVTVTAILGDRVRLGITAPGDTRIMREEILREPEEADPLIGTVFRGLEVGGHPLNGLGE